MEFENRLKSLNPRQRQAVEQIDGPLLVIAGPGTGKTELLSVRVANILKKTDTLPSSILCLTFTDSGAVNMRERLVGIIGEDAYKVAIHTFHSFGTDIISQNREYFFRGADFRPADELTQNEIIKSILDELDWHNPLASKNGDEYTHLKDILRVISEIKRAGLTSEELRNILNANQLVIDIVNPRISAVFANRISKNTVESFAPIAKFAAGIDQPKLPTGTSPYANVLALSIAHAVDEAIELDSSKPITAWKNSWCTKDAKGDTVLKDSLSAEKLQALIFVYSQYLVRMAESKLFDYDDMILNVIHAIETNPSLKATLSEKYQFILVDEFQDTNLAQLRLLFEIADYESPNIMAVGDDDQAIFSFQGADISNIHRFRERFQNPPVIVLTDNYRSTEQILQGARKVIKQGAERLENTIEGLSKELVAHSKIQATEIKLTSYPSLATERQALVEAIKDKIDSGVSPSDIAVIARKHKELVELLPYFAKKNISLNYEKYDNALDSPVVKLLDLLGKILILLNANHQEGVEALLPELLAHPSLQIESRTLWNLSVTAWREKRLWLEVMLTKTDLKPLAEWLIERSQQIENEPMEEFIDSLIGVPVESQTEDYISPIYNYYFSKSKLTENPEAYLDALESLSTIRAALRERSDEAQTFEDFVDYMLACKESSIHLTIARARSESASSRVNLLTAHKAKGLEYRFVYIVGASDNTWGEKARGGSRNIAYPANLPLAPAGNNYDERLRLFFVAMTRAKEELSISYSNANDTNKAQLIASFLSSEKIEEVIAKTDPAELTELAEINWQNRIVNPKTDDLKALLQPQLDKYKLSATHLNSFLDVSSGGPDAFLVNNLLHFPSAKSASASFGTAIHSTLAKIHNDMNVSGHMRPIEDILGDFEKYLELAGLSKNDFETYLSRGISALSTYLDKKSSSFFPGQKAELDFASQGVVLDGAKLKGSLDLVEIDEKSKTIFVIDYKTGKPSRDWKGKSPYDKIKLHKYRQQLMFYQILVEESRDYSRHSFSGSALQFVEPDKQTDEILRLEDTFSTEDLDRFKKLIKIVFHKIINLDLPDTSNYSEDLKGMIEFENDLVDGKI